MPIYDPHLNRCSFFLLEYAGEKGVELEESIQNDTDAMLDKLLEEGHDFNADHFPGATIDPR